MEPTIIGLKRYGVLRKIHKATKEDTNWKTVCGLTNVDFYRDTVIVDLGSVFFARQTIVCRNCWRNQGEYYYP